MSIVKKIILGLLVVLIIMQFYRSPKNQSVANYPNDISVVHSVPSNVASIVDKACNDCHSNNTRYPWYNNIQPVAWWLNDHVQEGKRGLNFNEFASYRISKQYHRLQDIIDEVKEGEMPLSSYTLIHTNARLSADEKSALINWAASIRDSMKANYPADSLVRPKKTKVIM